VTETFDIVYNASSPYGIDGTVHVREREVSGVDDAHALLWFVRQRLGVRADMADVFNEEPESVLECGCVVSVRFTRTKVSWSVGRKLGQRTPTTVYVRTEPCDPHSTEALEWHGRLQALPHDRRRKDQYEMAR
jgi:hypothetical protein